MVGYNVEQNSKQKKDFSNSDEVIAVKILRKKAAL
jgi:hypothetical protein